ncbi:SipW-dependent-type signal peptide-containing protein [Brachybacterium avium]|nr:SipW-dependent-type signal peptide-containing protein [Brachybacterium avium]
MSAQSEASARRWWIRLRLALAAGLLLGIGATGTLADWTDQEKVTATFIADVIPAPTLTRACEFKPGLLGLGARVRIYWRLPSGYALSDVEVQASTRGLGSVLAPLTGFSLTGNTVRQSDGTYRTDVPANLLGGLLGLGAELELALVVAPDDVGGWVSKSASVASNAGLVAGIGGKCRNLT